VRVELNIKLNKRFRGGSDRRGSDRFQTKRIPQHSLSSRWAKRGIEIRIRACL